MVRRRRSDGAGTPPPTTIFHRGYTLFNANIGYQYSKQISLSLNGNNLTDKEYYLGVSNRHRGGNNFYGAPRNVMFNVKWTY
jgi:outer membrane receptor for ferric coprogen and ferric-rhodotorulic acid